MTASSWAAEVSLSDSSRGEQDPVRVLSDESPLSPFMQKLLLLISTGSWRLTHLELADVAVSAEAAHWSSAKLTATGVEFPKSRPWKSLARAGTASTVFALTRAEPRCLPVLDGATRIFSTELRSP